MTIIHVIAVGHLLFMFYALCFVFIKYGFRTIFLLLSARCVLHVYDDFGEIAQRIYKAMSHHKI